MQGAKLRINVSGYSNNHIKTLPNHKPLKCPVFRGIIKPSSIFTNKPKSITSQAFVRIEEERRTMPVVETSQAESTRIVVSLARTQDQKDQPEVTCRTNQEERLREYFDSARFMH